MEEETCALCRRPLGRRREKHHLVPRSFGGRETVNLHLICHRKVHDVLSERELAQGYATPEALRRHPEIAPFLRWLRNKPADFHKVTRPSAARRRRR